MTVRLNDAVAARLAELAAAQQRSAEDLVVEAVAQLAEQKPRAMPEIVSASDPDTVEERFRQLERTWMAESGHLSSSRALTGHPAFRAITALGDAVVPLMLRDLSERPRLWVWALPEIVGEDPVPPADRGNIAKMSDAWLRWGREHGYRC